MQVDVDFVLTGLQNRDPLTQSMRTKIFLMESTYIRARSVRPTATNSATMCALNVHFHRILLQLKYFALRNQSYNFWPASKLCDFIEGLMDLLLQFRLNKVKLLSNRARYSSLTID